MTSSLRTLWQARAPRERKVLVMLAALLGVLLYLAFSLSAQRAREKLGTSVARLHVEARQLDLGADEIMRLRAIPPPVPSQKDLRLALQAGIEAAGLSAALVRIDAVDANRVKAVFGVVPFADWVAWVEKLQSQQIGVELVRIESLAKPGLVGITATLIRPGA